MNCPGKRGHKNIKRNRLLFLYELSMSKEVLFLLEKVVCPLFQKKSLPPFFLFRRSYGYEYRSD